MSAPPSKLSLARLAGAVGVFTWLVVPFQLHLVNSEGWSPLLFLWLGAGVGLLYGLAGAGWGWLLERLGGKLPRPVLVLLAVAVPASLVFFPFMWKILTGGVLSRRADIVMQPTILAFGLAAAGFVLAWLLRRRWWTPMPTVVAVAASYVALALLSGESQPSMTDRESLVQELTGKKAPATARRLLVFGSDGLDWKVIRDLMDKGELPNFQRLMEGSVYADYQTMEPTLSPIIWNTMATGLPWEEHRVTEFIYYALPGAERDVSLSGTFLQPVLNRLHRENPLITPLIRLAGSAHRRRLTFWEILDLGRVNTAVVNWWATHPPADTAGVVVSDQAVELAIKYAQPAGEGLDWRNKAKDILKLDSWLRKAVQPQSAVTEVAAEFEPEVVEGYFEEARELLANVDFGLDDGLPQKQVDRFARALAHGEIVRKLLEQDKQEVYVFYDRLTDQISHLYWQFYRPDEAIYGERGPSPEAVEGLKDMVPAAYRTADRILGRLVEAAGDDANILVVSDHGFSAIHPPNKFEWGKEDRNPPRSGHHHHGEPGVFMLAGPNVCTGQSMKEVSILDFAPTVLYLRGLPVAENLSGRVVSEAICEEWVAAHPIQTLPTFEYPGWRENQEAAVADADSLLDLGELGYIAGGPGDKEEEVAPEDPGNVVSDLDEDVKLIEELGALKSRGVFQIDRVVKLLSELTQHSDPDIAAAAREALGQ